MKRFTIIFLLLMAGCTSLAISTAEKLEATGVWQFEVVGIDHFRLYGGEISINITDSDILTGQFRAVSLGDLTVSNIRYRNRRLTFTVRTRPGSLGGLAFSLYINGNRFDGVVYETTNSMAVSVRGFPAGELESVDIVGRRTSR